MALSQTSQSFETELRSSIDQVNAMKFKVLDPTKVSVSTISAIALLNADSIKLSIIEERYQEVVGMGKENGKEKGRGLPLGPRFSNAVIIKLYRGDDEHNVNGEYRPVNGKNKKNRYKKVGEKRKKNGKKKGKKQGPIAVKIFSNGTLHITGPVSVMETVEFVEKTCTLLDAIFKKAKGSFKADDISVQMVNTNFHIQRPLKKEFVHQLLRKNDLKSWIPESHPAVRLQIDRKTTVLIFESGAVIITGLKNGKALVDAYQTLMSILDKELCVKELGESTMPLSEIEEKQLENENVNMDMNVNMNEKTYGEDYMDDDNIAPLLPPPSPEMY